MNYKFKIILDKILNELIPLTDIGVSKGNKIFGALILKKNDYSTVVVDTNNETANPLFHGEISTINSFFKHKEKINPKDCLFISSHEPCSLCLSAITWSGFDNFFYLYPYEDTENVFNIPHDLKILEEVFYIKNGNYNKQNNYWKSYEILKEITKLDNQEYEQLKVIITKIKAKYDRLSSIYQKNKNNNRIPLN